MVNFNVIVTLVVIFTTTVLASPYQEEIIEQVQSSEKELLWEPGVNFHSEANKEFFDTLIGNFSIEDDLSKYKTSQSHCDSICATDSTENLYGHDHNTSSIPDTFDARQKWPECPSIGTVHDQGECKADYAFSTTSAISDRICVATKGNQKTTISAQTVISCCKDCGRGCKGGIPQEVWFYLKRRGIPSGGAYDSNEGCQPYLKKPIGFKPSALYSSNHYKTPKCKTNCYNPNFGKTKVRDDLHKGKTTASRLCCCTVKGEIFKRGPITTSMILYEDFLTYKSGIYHHVSGKRLGHISVKVIGYGIENGKQYWLAVNSWSKNWGDNGVFKILKGDGDCEFEFYMFAGDVNV